MTRPAPPRLAGLAATLVLLTLLAVPARAEVTQRNGVIVSFGGSISPRLLPRIGTAPIGVTVEARVRTVSGRLPPPLRRISLEINHSGVLDRRGLPSCRVGQLQSSSTRQALAACGGARVGGGRVSGQITIADQRPFAFHGRVLAFNGKVGAAPAILAHLYLSSPIALTFVLVFRVDRVAGTYGTRLTTVVPPQTRRLARITGFRLHFGRRFEAGGRRRSYLSAGCPAPEGFPGATFALARARFGFVGGTTLHSVVVRSCRARG